MIFFMIVTSYIIEPLPSISSEYILLIRFKLLFPLHLFHTRYNQTHALLVDKYLPPSTIIRMLLSYAMHFAVLHLMDDICLVKVTAY